jgi:hypothetical protein
VKSACEYQQRVVSACGEQGEIEGLADLGTSTENGQLLLILLQTETMKALEMYQWK